MQLDSPDPLVSSLSSKYGPPLSLLAQLDQVLASGLTPGGRWTESRCWRHPRQRLPAAVAEGEGGCGSAADWAGHQHPGSTGIQGPYTLTPLHQAKQPHLTL